MSDKENKYLSLEKQIDKLQSSIISCIGDRNRQQTGRVLTVIDGVVADPEQRKAVKDLVYTAQRDDYYFDELRDVINQFRKANGIEEVDSAIYAGPERENIFKK